MSRTIGVIGIGAMGEPMAASLLRAGFRVVVCAHRNRAPLERLTQAGAVDGVDPAGVGAQSEVLITMVPDAPQVEESLFGAHGAAATAKAGTLFIDMSTISPIATKAFDERLRSMKMRFMDAPVSGGTARAKSGTLTIMIGASDADLADAKPVLEAMGTPILVGPVGMGETVKLANQTMIANIMLGNIEALVFAAKAGADIAKTREVILTSTGGNYLLDKVLPNTWLSGSFAGNFALDLFRKDIAAVLDAARAMGIAMPSTGMAYQLFTASSGEGHGQDDYSSVATFYERAAQVPPTKL